MTLQGYNAAFEESDAALGEAVLLFRNLQSSLNAVIADGVAKLVDEPSWGLLHSMYERAEEQLQGCFILISNRYFAPAEALCRTAIEAAVNLYYISLGDTEGKFLSYFKHYVEEERSQNHKWLKSIERSPHSEDDKNHHKHRIMNKDFALGQYEAFINLLCQDGAREYKEIERWPNAFQRFCEINKEVDYRTVYASLCSQSHNDAEDLLNKFIAGVCQDFEVKGAQKQENEDFALFMAVVALATLVESAAIYLGKFSLGANYKLLPIMDQVRSLAQSISERPSMGGAQ